MDGAELDYDVELYLPEAGGLGILESVLAAWALKTQAFPDLDQHIEYKGTSAEFLNSCARKSNRDQGKPE